MKLLLALGLALALSVSSWWIPALADRVTIQDPDDVEARFDIASVTVTHVQRDDGSWRLRHRITTQESWRTRRLCGSSFTVAIRDSGRRIQVFWRDALKARVVTAKGEKISTVAVWRPDNRSVIVAVRPRLLGAVGDSYSWRATSTSGACKCDDTAACGALLDVAPDEGWKRHHL